VTRSESSKLREAAPHGVGATPWSSGSCDAFLARRERTNRDVISVRISERELLRSSVRIEVWFLFEPTDERACPLKRQVEIIDTEEQQEAVAGYPVIGAHQ
jgi:hypothetical protein